MDREISFAGYEPNRLLGAVIEHLRTPLLHIARGTEGIPDRLAMEQMRVSAQGALEMINAFLMAKSQLDFELSPVAPANIAYDAAERLQDLAKSYGCAIEVDCQGKMVPIIANAEALKTALGCLGQAFITASKESSGQKQKPTVTLSVSRTKEGISTGVFADLEGLNTVILRRSRALYGKAKMPLSPSFSTSGAEIFIADVLFSGMNTALSSLRHNRRQGLAAIFATSKQLSLGLASP